MFGKRELFIDFCSRPGRESSTVDVICGAMSADCHVYFIREFLPERQSGDNLQTPP
jgi:hypothetical protein